MAWSCSTGFKFPFERFPGATVGVTKMLGARNAREQWEAIFNKHYIQPVLASLEQKVGIAMQQILDDDDQGKVYVVFIIRFMVLIGY